MHAGLAYKVTNNLTLEMSYRYVSLGNGVTGDLRAFDGTNNVYNPMQFHDITSQDVNFGMRWNFDAAGLCAAAAGHQGLSPSIS